MNFSLHLIICVLLPLSGFVSGVLNFRSLDVSAKVIMLQLLCATVAELVGIRLTHLRIPNVSVFNVYMIMEFLLLGMAPLFVIREKKVRIAIVFLLCLGLSFHMYNILVNSISFFANKSIVLYGFILALLYFYTLIKSGQYSSGGLLNPLSLICVAHIVYFIGCIPFFGLFHVVLTDYPGVFESLFNINFVLSIIRYLLIAFSFYLWSDQKLKLSKVQTHDR